MHLVAKLVLPINMRLVRDFGLFSAVHLRFCMHVRPSNEDKVAPMT